MNAICAAMLFVGFVILYGSLIYKARQDTPGPDDDCDWPPIPGPIPPPPPRKS